VKFRSLFIAMSASLMALLSACSTPQPAEKPRVIQQGLLVKCPDQLSQLSDGTAGEVAVTMKEWASTYHDCKTRHNGLVDVLAR